MAYNMNLSFLLAVYSLFALCEYIVVISNVVFHGMAIVDLSDGKIMYVDSSMQLLHKSL